nr:MAG TPA: hypothetical protein [Caudoviricetes sp.]DAO92956.1 MAG TPA: hypothetical protein [Herelleviridae sp.]
MAGFLLLPSSTTHLFKGFCHERIKYIRRND